MFCDPSVIIEDRQLVNHNAPSFDDLGPTLTFNLLLDTPYNISRSQLSHADAALENLKPASRQITLFLRSFGVFMDVAGGIAEVIHRIVEHIAMTSSSICARSILMRKLR